ncbi:hypothetical protein [Streptomyces sp. NPDC005970]|uniref:hypothetical protein n=1 Tax=Streptomyces sp. NPDC005970 TaxID=3156723 RepID=UPI0033F7FFA1
MTKHRWAAAAATVLMTTALIGSSSPGWASTGTPSTANVPESALELPDPPTAEEARAELDELTVAPEDDVPGYSRAKFPHWIIQHGTCDTRVICTAGSGD